MAGPETLEPQSGARTYIDAGGLSWAFAGAWRCVPLGVLVALTLGPATHFDGSEFGRALCCGLAVLITAFIAFLFLGEEIAARRIKQQRHDLIAHGRLGLILGWGVLQLPMPWADAQRIMMVTGSYPGSQQWRDLPEIVLVTALPICLILSIMVGLRIRSPEDHGFIRRLVRHIGRFATVAGGVIGAANLCFTVSAMVVIQHQPPDIGLLPFFLYVTCILAKSACAGCLAALLVSLVAIRIRCINYGDHIERAMKVGLVAGGLVSLAAGFGLSIYLSTGNYQLGIIHNFRGNALIFSVVLDNWVASSFFSGGILLGGLSAGLLTVLNPAGRRHFDAHACDSDSLRS